jgi:uncharacterized protein
VLLEWDDAKNAKNIAARGISFAIVERLDWDTTVTARDDRLDYGEPRYITLGLIDAALYVIVHTPRGERTRIISVRRANRKERDWYATQA